MHWRRFPYLTAALFLAVVVADVVITINQAGSVLSSQRPADERSFPFLNTGIVFRDGMQFTACVMGVFAVMGLIEVGIVRRLRR